MTEEVTAHNCDSCEEELVVEVRKDSTTVLKCSNCDDRYVAERKEHSLVVKGRLTET